MLVQQQPVISVAPMMGYTDRHFRYLARLMSRHVHLYTEMVTTQALLLADNGLRFLAHNVSEHPLALQLGGSEPEALAQCAKIAEQQGFSEVNLNIGCPSDRVQQGRFGACLMAEPQLVAECVAAMIEQVAIPVTVKTRIGIDELDSYEHLQRFIATVAESGCQQFIIHARKAWLKGLSPKQNRSVPPLHYDVVHRIKQDFPQLHISINGGITTLDQIEQQLQQVDGVMIGREFYHNAYLLAYIDGFYDVEHKPKSRLEIIRCFLPYIEQQRQAGSPLRNVTRHLMGLLHGVPGAKHWRRLLSTQQQDYVKILNDALATVEL